MVDFRGFKHSDVPKEGRGSGNKHRGVQKSKRLGLNIPKKADFRGFKHSDVPEGAREGVNKHQGVQKSKKNFLSRFERGRLPVAARLPALLWIVFLQPQHTQNGQFSGFQGFRRAKGGRGGGNKHRGVKKATRNISAIAELTLRESRLLPPLTRSAVDRFFYSLNIPKMVDFRGFKHSDVPTGAGEVGTSIGESKKAHIGETGPEVRGIDASLLLPAPFPKVPRGASGGCRPYMFRG
ncbi:hypothetical protein ACOMHN_002777 [Nucella lapillus]